MYDVQQRLQSGQVLEDALMRGYDPSGMTWDSFVGDFGQMLDAIRAYQTVGTQTSTTMGTTTSATAVVLTCGSSVADSTVGRTSSLGHESGDAKHIFCAPEGIGEVFFSTCGSSFDTSLYVMGQDLWRSCDQCGSCWPMAELKVAGLSPGWCYDVVVDGHGTAEGAFQLSVSCCVDVGQCGGRGIVRHRSGASRDGACRCDCFWPFTGPNCEACRAELMSVFRNGTCEPCLAFADTEVLALHSTNVTWSPNFIDASCHRAIRIGHFVHRAAHSGFLRTVADAGDAGLAFGLGSCASSTLSSLTVHITANGRLQGSVHCAPQIMCPELVLSGNRTMPSVSIEMLQWDRAAATTALSLVDLLMSLFPSGHIPIRLVPWNGENATLNATSPAQALAFFNRWLGSASLGARPCSTLGSVLQPQMEADGLLVLVGLCEGGLGEAAEMLSELPGKILHLGGEESGRSEFSISVGWQQGLAGFSEELCGFLVSWLERPECFGQVNFFPKAVPERTRRFLTFKGFCLGETLPSCCFAGQCSNSVYRGSDGHLRCATPLLKSGLYSVSLWSKTENTTMTFESKLDVGVRRFRTRDSYLALSWIFTQNHTYIRTNNPVNSGHEGGLCCGHIALSRDFNVIGAASPNKCWRNWYRHYGRTLLPGPPIILEENPFHEALLFQHPDPCTAFPTLRLPACLTELCVPEP